VPQSALLAAAHAPITAEEGKNNRMKKQNKLLEFRHHVAHLRTTPALKATP
jgi:hypothetical protein